ncbi:MAG: hypothetical protein RBS57_20890, partial [Desulforhabdus sp.]|nr:hypothetical protein [Desulforhabdus sp.]
MRITTEILNKLAKDSVMERVKAQGLLAAYLYGSLPAGNPLLGGAADIDLCLIHIEEFPVDREIIRLSEEVHLDIVHHTRQVYRQARELRRNPWMGPVLYSCKALYDPQHFIDFIQASVRGQYHQPENVIVRSRQLIEAARQIWFTFDNEAYLTEAHRTYNYLNSLYLSASSIANLSGKLLPTRQMLVAFAGAAESIGRGGFYAGLIGLLGGQNVEPAALKSWLPAWDETYLALPGGSTPPALHRHRKTYYRRGIEALLESDRPLDSLWPLFFTWTELASLLGPDHPQFASWFQAAEQL